MDSISIVWCVWEYHLEDSLWKFVSSSKPNQSIPEIIYLYRQYCETVNKAKRLPELRAGVVVNNQDLSDFPSNEQHIARTLKPINSFFANIYSASFNYPHSIILDNPNAISLLLPDVEMIHYRLLLGESYDNIFDWFVSLEKRIRHRTVDISNGTVSRDLVLSELELLLSRNLNASYYNDSFLGAYNFASINLMTEQLEVADDIMLYSSYCCNDRECGYLGVYVSTLRNKVFWEFEDSNIPKFTFLKKPYLQAFAEIVKELLKRCILHPISVLDTSISSVVS